VTSAELIASYRRDYNQLAKRRPPPQEVEDAHKKLLEIIEIRNKLSPLRDAKIRE